MKLYLVTDGSYSDYRLIGIYSTSEKALAAKELYDADNDIEEFELDEIPPSPPGLFPWSVEMREDGSMEGFPRRISINDFEEKITGYRPREYAFIHVWARGAEHAIKIANEKRVQLIANGEWESWYRKK